MAALGKNMQSGLLQDAAVRVDIFSYTVPADLSDVFQCDIQQRRGLASGQVLASCRSTTFVSRLYRIISTKRKAVRHTLEREAESFNVYIGRLV